MNNIPAFPIQGYSTRNGQGFQLVMADGMTLRDYFAAKAMQGLVANNNTNPFEICKAAYIVADAMMEARNAAQ